MDLNELKRRNQRCDDSVGAMKFKHQPSDFSLIFVKLTWQVSGLKGAVLSLHSLKENIL